MNICTIPASNGRQYEGVHKKVRTDMKGRFIILLTVKHIITIMIRMSEG